MYLILACVSDLEKYHSLPHWLYFSLSKDFLVFLTRACPFLLFALVISSAWNDLSSNISLSFFFFLNPVHHLDFRCKMEEKKDNEEEEEKMVLDRKINFKYEI